MKPFFENPWLLFLFAGALSFPACQRSAEKEVLSVEIKGGATLYPPKVVITDDLVLLNVGKGFHLPEMEYTLELSPNALVFDQPRDLSSPADIYVKAQNGTVKTYTIIATQVTGTFTTWNDLFWDPRELSEIYRCTGAVWKMEGIGAAVSNEGLDIQLDHCDLLGGNEDFLGIFLRNKKPGDPLAGSYCMGYNIIGNASARWSGKTAFGETESFYFPYSGAVEITDYNEKYQTISGAFEDIIFFNQVPKPVYALSGTFTNVRIVN